MLYASHELRHRLWYQKVAVLPYLAQKSLVFDDWLVTLKEDLSAQELVCLEPFSKILLLLVRVLVQVRLELGIILDRLHFTDVEILHATALLVSKPDVDKDGSPGLGVVN